MMQTNESVLDLVTGLDHLRPLLEARRWPELEWTAQQVCVALSGPFCAERVAAVDTSTYEEELHRAALEAALNCPPEAHAVYFEFDPDNDWESTFFLCSGEHPDGGENTEWACDWVHHVAGPDFEPFARLYAEHAGAHRGASGIGCALYLLVRTLVACERALDGVDFGDRVVFVAFHDAEDVLRVSPLP
jgi:hypothetical protein